MLILTYVALHEITWWIQSFTNCHTENIVLSCTVLESMPLQANHYKIRCYYWIVQKIFEKVYWISTLTWNNDVLCTYLLI